MRRELQGFTPPLGVTWQAARIEEATYPDDDLATAIETVALSPPVTNTQDPPTYNFTTNAATLEEGWYRVVWLDASGINQATAWQELRALSPYAPSVGDVATLMFSRLIEDGGFRTNNFTDQTRPTAYEVQQVIAMHTPLLFARLGRLDNLGCSNQSDLRSAARTLAAQRVKLEVEAMYWPEEFGEQANVETLRQMWDADVVGLIASLEACRASDDDGGTGGESESRTDPAWRFPPPPRLRY